LNLLNAELALETGDTAQALGILKPLVASASQAAGHEVRERTVLLWARTLEANGLFFDAIEALEDWNVTVGTAVPVDASIVLCRCYREAGDFGRAVDVGESALEALRAAGLDGGDEAIQLAVTTAAAYFDRGDTTHAVRMARDAAKRAEQLGSPTARASAYWNASIFESERGALPSSIMLAKRALALLGEGRDKRNLARLRVELGLMSLRLDPPDLADAERYLKRAYRELHATSGSVTDIAICETGLARVQLGNGNRSEAREIAGRAVDALAGIAPAAAAEAAAVLGKIEAADGNPDVALTHFRAAIGWLTGLGQDRGAAQLWVDLGVELETLGEVEAARDAFRRAAIASGLNVPMWTSVSS
jgi:tetratricopeptide (TPR) repeat protein